MSSRDGADSPRRREQAAATRRDILEAALRLFERQGYSATSMAAVAAEAGVALKTVYLAFETKRGVLIALWHLLLRGDEAPVPVGERPWYREVIDEPDPEAAVAAERAKLAKRQGASRRALPILQNAAPADPEIGALWNRIQSEFYDNQRTIVESLDQKQALAPSLDVDRATDIVWTLSHPSVYQLLVVDRGWSADEYEAWLGDAFCRELLAPAASQAESKRLTAARAALGRSGRKPLVEEFRERPGSFRRVRHHGVGQVPCGIVHAATRRARVVALEHDVGRLVEPEAETVAHRLSGHVAARPHHLGHPFR